MNKLNCIIFSIILSIGFLSTHAQSTIIYVSTDGDNNNSGAWNAPVETISHAISLADGNDLTYIRIATGRYDESNIIELKSNIILEGCWTFNPSDSLWTKKFNDSTVVYIDGFEYGNGANHKIGIRSNNATNWTLQNLTVYVQGADNEYFSDRAVSGKGTSIYGLHISGNSENTHIIECTITTGNGGNGLAGISGINGADGANGGSGYVTMVAVAYGGGSVAGATGPGAGTGIRKGGDGGASSGGSNGGVFTSTAQNSPGSAGQNGGDAANGAAGGSGGPAPSGKGNPGVAGGNGTNGEHGITIYTYPSITFSALFEPAAQAGSGSEGHGGAGGGGGSGAGGCSFEGSNSGGSGGSGGQGGTGGTGGYGGGASICIYMYNTNSNTVITNSVLLNGAGGAGGNGGAGGAGGTGGNGGAGRTNNDGCKDGGTGGKGGKGGNGGNGENGINGPSYPIVNVNTDGTYESSNPAQSISQSIIEAKYSGYTNSQITLTKSSDQQWQLAPGLHFVNDKSPNSSSYNTSSNTIVVTTEQLQNYTINESMNPLHIVKEQPLGAIQIEDTLYFEDNVSATYSDISACGYAWTIRDVNGLQVSSSTNETFDINTLGYSAADTGSIYHISLVVRYKESGYSDYIWKSIRVMPKEIDITISETSFTYDGTEKSVIVGTSKQGINTNVTYNGSEDLPVDAGSYDVLVKVTSPNYTGQATATLIIEKALVNHIGITLPEHTTYDSTKKTVAIITNPSNLDYTISYSGDTCAIDAGSYKVIVTINDKNYIGIDSCTMTINKAEAAISFSDLKVVYDGTNKGATITTVPENLPVNITYNDPPVLPTDAGSYTVYAEVNDHNYMGVDSATFVIKKRSAIISIHDTTLTYDGNAHSMNFDIEPNLSYTITYNGKSEEPVDAGVYNIIIISEPNSNIAQTIQTATMTIEKADAIVMLFNDTLTYNGDERLITVTTNPAGLPYSASYNNSYIKPVNAGTYQVEVTITDDNYKGLSDTILIVKKANAQISYSNLSHIYDGMSFIPDVEITPSGLTYQTSYNGSSSNLPVNAGKYIVRTIINDDNYQGMGTDTLIIEKAQATISFDNLNQIYDNTSKAVDVTTTPDNLNTILTYEGKSKGPIKVGKYEVIATINDNNYVGAVTDSLTIEKALATFEITNVELTYNGNAQSAVINTIPANVRYNITYNNSDELPVAIGEYEMNITITDANYTGDTTLSMYINAKVAQIEVDDTEHIYDGTTKSIIVTTTPPVAHEITYSLNGENVEGAINVGTYDVSVRIIEEHHEKSILNTTLTIHKASPSIECDSVYTCTYDGTEKSINVSITPIVPCSVTYHQNNQQVSPINAGTYEVKVHINDGNCHEHIVYRTLIINKANGDIYLSGLSHIYDGSPKSITTATNPDGLTVEVTYNGSTTPPTTVGEYEVIATIVDNNYVGSIKNTLNILEDLSVEDIKINKDIKLYPNPATSLATLELYGMQGNVNIRIIDIQGRTISSKDITCDDSYQESIDLTSFSSGIYVIQILHQNNLYLKKLIVK